MGFREREERRENEEKNVKRGKQTWRVCYGRSIIYSRLLCCAKFSDAEVYHVGNDYFLPLASSRARISLRQTKALQRAMRSFVGSIDINCSRVSGRFFSAAGVDCSYPLRCRDSSWLIMRSARSTALNATGKQKMEAQRQARCAHGTMRGITTEMVALSRFKCQRYATFITPSAMRASLIYLSLPRVVCVQYICK